jgi:carboxypeptidase T
MIIGDKIMRKNVTITLVLLVSVLMVSGIQLHIQTTTAEQTITNDSHIKNSSLYRMTPPIDMNDFPANGEIVGGKPGIYHDILLDEKSYSSLKDKGYDLRLLNNKSLSTKPLDSDKYHTLEGMVQSLNTISTEYENITSLFSIGKSYEDRDIWCLEITDNPGVNENEPGVLLLGLHHAREWPSLEITLHIAENLTKQYDRDSTIQNLVNSRRIWIIPCVNPDGYYYSYDEGNDWRKNRHYLEEFNSYGIDLNRNYAGAMNGEPLGMWGSTGMSHNPGSEVYCGKNQFSELETQAVKQFFLSHDINSCISWHTYSELVMWPWGYSTDVKAPNNDYLSNIGSQIASRITKQSGTGSYTPIQSAKLYPTTGDTTDWMYSYSHYVLGDTCFAYTIEACSSFHPSPSVMDQVCKENMDGALYLIEETQLISEIPERVIPPIITEVNESDESYSISWDVTNDDSNPQKYELQELKNKYQYIDSTMVEPNAWIFNGFYNAPYRSHSESQSYYSSAYSKDVSSMTTRYPMYINESIQNISFYCWYDTNEQGGGNKAFFEISTNGRQYTVIDSYSGESNGWMRQNYSLTDYIGKSIYLRFRYAKTSNNAGEGFYVDDIDPVIYYYNVESLEDTVLQDQYNILKNHLEDSYFRIRGYNEEYGWGDWSQLVPLGQINNENNPPGNPIITGPERPEKEKSSTYTIRSVDPDDDKLYYLISWGDGASEEEWQGPYSSNEEVTFNHTWEKKGEYQIKVRAKDEHGMLSEWSTLTVTAPKFGSFSSIWDLLLSYFSLFFNGLN